MSSNEVKEPIFYKVNHRYRDVIIVPYCAISRVVDFISTPLIDRRVVTTDDIKCKVWSLTRENICELEENILFLYKISAWEFLKRWHTVYPHDLLSTEFIILKLSKE